jgi:hypothetical protein
MVVLNLPGELQRFLSVTPNASRRDKYLGTLSGRGKTEATITAIIASDPTDSKRQARGIEFLLKDEDGEPRAAVYLDEAGLKPFQHQLTDLWDVASRIAQGKSGRIEPEGPQVTGAVNEVTRPGSRGTEKACVLIAGWYMEQNTPGLFMSSTPGADLYFPNLPLSSLIGVIAQGRAFLNPAP